jgi:hypothetical protein
MSDFKWINPYILSAGRNLNNNFDVFSNTCQPKHKNAIKFHFYVKKNKINGNMKNFHLILKPGSSIRIVLMIM